MILHPEYALPDSALIQARSCERFALLARHNDDDELSQLYESLYASEALPQSK